MKKIVIILESHIDHISCAAEVELVKYLQKAGFNALGMEFPTSGSELVENLEHTIKFSTEQYLLPSLQSLIETHKLTHIHGKPINTNTLLDLNFLDLCKLLQLYVSSTRYADGARIILGIRSTQNKLYMAQTYSDSMTIVGIDPALTPTESMRPIAENYRDREIKMADNIEKLFKQKKLAVHIVGKNHAPGLVEFLAKKQLLEHTVFLDLQSPITMVIEPLYLDFVQKNKHLLHQIVITDGAGIAPHLERINTLLEVNLTQTAELKEELQFSRDEVLLYIKRHIEAAKDGAKESLALFKKTINLPDTKQPTVLPPFGSYCSQEKEITIVPGNPEWKEIEQIKVWKKLFSLQ